MNWGKQASSRAIRSQTLNYAGNGTNLSTTFSAQTYQIRVFSQVAGYAIIGDASSLTTTTLTTAPPSGTQVPAVIGVPASTVGGEYFTTTPGQAIVFSSTSTSSGFLNISEMA